MSALKIRVSLCVTVSLSRTESASLTTRPSATRAMPDVTSSGHHLPREGRSAGVSPRSACADEAGSTAAGSGFINMKEQREPRPGAGPLQHESAFFSFGERASKREADAVASLGPALERSTRVG